MFFRIITLGFVINYFNCGLFAQSNDSIKNGKIELFKVIAIADTTKSHITGIISDCNDNLAVGGAMISFHNIKLDTTITICCSDTLGNFKLWLDYGYYNITFSALGYNDFNIYNILCGSGNMINSRFCMIQKPEIKLNKPIILDKCYEKYNKSNK